MADKALTTKQPREITSGEPLPFEVATTQARGQRPPDILCWYAQRAKEP